MIKITPTPKDVLIAVDIQNDFCTGSLAVAQSEQIIPLINGLMAYFDQIVLTQDWHPSQHISFASTHNLLPNTSIKTDYGRQILWQSHCVQHTWGAQFHPNLYTQNATYLIKKGDRACTDSYSAFLEADGTPTPLVGYLHTLNIQRVFVVGLATDFCVAYTAIDASKLGFDTYVIEDACRAIDVNHSLQKAWHHMQKHGVHRIASKNLQPNLSF